MTAAVKAGAQVWNVMFDRPVSQARIILDRTTEYTYDLFRQAEAAVVVAARSVLAHFGAVDSVEIEGDHLTIHASADLRPEVATQLRLELEDSDINQVIHLP